MKKIIKTLSTAILICGFPLAALAQTNQSMEWKQIEEIEPDCKTFAVSVPLQSNYYSLKSWIVTRDKTDTGKGSGTTVGAVGFNATFEIGVDAAIFDRYQKEFADFKKSIVTRSKVGGIKFSKESEVHEFFLSGDVLHHLWTTGANESNALTQQFFDSLTFDRKMIEPEICARVARPYGGMGSGDGGDGKLVLPKVTGTSKKVETENSPQGMGIGGKAEAQNPPPTPTQKKGDTTALQILSKPKADYTPEAKKNNVSGVVKLRIVFAGDGTIGSITPVSGLPDGLTEQAIAAARKITFVPASKNGQPITVSKTLDYSFVIY